MEQSAAIALIAALSLVVSFGYSFAVQIERHLDGSAPMVFDRDVDPAAGIDSILDVLKRTRENARGSLMPKIAHGAIRDGIGTARKISEDSTRRVSGETLKHSPISKPFLVAFFAVAIAATVCVFLCEPSFDMPKSAYILAGWIVSAALSCLFHKKNLQVHFYSQSLALHSRKIVLQKRMPPQERQVESQSGYHFGRYRGYEVALFDHSSGRPPST